MYSLQREGARVLRDRIAGQQLGPVDRPHIFVDGNGEILPASTLRMLSGRGVH